MIAMYPLLFISGPHGGGKTTLIQRLVQPGSIFLENDFDIDFTTDFPKIASLSSFERSLVRLYHRYYVLLHARNQRAEHPDKCIVTNRTVYDSEAYIHVYHDLQWISEGEYQKLSVILQSFQPRPEAVVLNPPLDVILQRLAKRNMAATRTLRDRIFVKEDQETFLVRLHAYFQRFQGDRKVLYLEENSPADIARVIAWVKVRHRPQRQKSA